VFLRVSPYFRGVETLTASRPSLSSDPVLLMGPHASALAQLMTQCLQVSARISGSTCSQWCPPARTASRSPWMSSSARRSCLSRAPPSGTEATDSSAPVPLATQQWSVIESDIGNSTADPSGDVIKYFALVSYDSGKALALLQEQQGADEPWQVRDAGPPRPWQALVKTSAGDWYKAADALTRACHGLGGLHLHKMVKASAQHDHALVHSVVMLCCPKAQATLYAVLQLAMSDFDSTSLSCHWAALPVESATAPAAAEEQPQLLCLQAAANPEALPHSRGGRPRGCCGRQAEGRPQRQAVGWRSSSVLDLHAGLQLPGGSLANFVLASSCLPLAP